MKKYTHKNIRKLTKVGKTSYSIIIPKRFIRQLKWKERQKLVLDLKGKSVIIKDYK